jgi:hypothetical protein
MWDAAALGSMLVSISVELFSSKLMVVTIQRLGLRLPWFEFT